MGDVILQPMFTTKTVADLAKAIASDVIFLETYLFKTFSEIKL